MSKISKLVATASLALLLSAPSAFALEKVSLRLPWILNVQAAAYIMAKEKGFYEAEGLDVEIRPGGPQINPNQLVATGQDTFGANDYPNLIVGSSQGMPLMVVAACWQSHPGGVYALKGSGIKEPKDLIGKTLAYDEGGPWILVRAMLKKAGVPLDQIRTIPVSGNEVLMNKSVDARTGFVINGPIAIELAGMETMAFAAADYGVPAAAEVIFTSQQFAKSNPQTVRRFVAATIKGYEYAYANRQETLDVIIRGNGQLNREQQRLQLDRQAPLIFTERAKKEGLCSFSGDDLKQVADILQQFGAMRGTVNVDAMYSKEFLPK